MRDENGKLTNYEKPDIILKEKAFPAMSEDLAGHLYFSPYEFDRENKKQVINADGVAVFFADSFAK